MFENYSVKHALLNIKEYWKIISEKGHNTDSISVQWSKEITANDHKLLTATLSGLGFSHNSETYCWYLLLKTVSLTH